MYLPRNLSNYWACDVEADDLLAKEVYVVCAENVGTGEEVVLTNYDDIRTFFSRDAFFVFHNGIGFDGPTLNRLCKTRLNIGNLIDTMVMSMIYSPSLEGGHSLKAWGKRVKLEKIDFEDFSRLTDEMITYCRRDAKICARIFKALVTRMTKVGFSERGIELEHRAWQLSQQQKKTGFAFDIGEAHVLYSKLRQLETDIAERVHAVWPPERTLLGTYRRPYIRDGRESANLARHRLQYPEVRVSPDDDSYEVYGDVPFNIGSPNQRTQKLLELGWEPGADERTPTGNPKPTSKGKLVPTLEAFVKSSGQEGPRLIANWMEINARANMVNTWIEAYNETTGCIHGSLWLANTRRYRHSDPNTANIPAVRLDGEGKSLRGLDGVFTYEARDLWTTRDRTTRSLVGVDAKGIQLRVLAHYLNNKKFTEAVLDGDPHSYNQEIGGFGSRSVAKTLK